jgi:hypothetical protein
LAIAAAVFGLAFSASAFADPVATLTGFTGRVSVNQGEEFRPATQGMRLNPGDRVMVQDNSSAQLKFDDECPYPIGENKIVTVPEKSNCAGGAPLVQELAPTGGSAIGAAGATATGNGGVWWMVGIVTAIDLWWLNEGDDDVVSP